MPADPRDRDQAESGRQARLGGVLPQAKITQEIARHPRHPGATATASARPRHTSFDDVDSLLDFVERLASETGLPVGIKSAVGESAFWDDLARLMAGGGRGVDFITIDGGEGGTGAGPLVFRRPRRAAVQGRLQSRARDLSPSTGSTSAWSSSARASSDSRSSAVFAFALGCDMVNVAREALLAIGCIQAQRCHTNHCPTGIATQHPWLMRGLDPTLKAGAARQLRRHAAQGAADAQPRVRRATSVAHHRRPSRAARRPLLGEDRRGSLWVLSRPPALPALPAPVLRLPSSPPPCYSPPRRIACSEEPFPDSLRPRG